MGATADGPVAEAAEPVSVGIERPRRIGFIFCVQQASFFDREQENEPIHQAQELAKESLPWSVSHRATCQAKLLVRGV